MNIINFLIDKNSPTILQDGERKADLNLGTNCNPATGLVSDDQQPEPVTQGSVSGSHKNIPRRDPEEVASPGLPSASRIP